MRRATFLPGKAARAQSALPSRPVGPSWPAEPSAYERVTGKGALCEEFTEMNLSFAGGSVVASGPLTLFAGEDRLWSARSTARNPRRPGSQQAQYYVRSGDNATLHKAVSNSTKSCFRVALTASAPELVTAPAPRQESSTSRRGGEAAAVAELSPVRCTAMAAPLPQLLPALPQRWSVPRTGGRLRGVPAPFPR